MAIGPGGRDGRGLMDATSNAGSGGGGGGGGGGEVKAFVEAPLEEEAAEAVEAAAQTAYPALEPLSKVRKRPVLQAMPP